jgi:hypothetical protein
MQANDREGLLGGQRALQLSDNLSLDLGLARVPARTIEAGSRYGSR